MKFECHKVLFMQGNIHGGTKYESRSYLQSTSLDISLLLSFQTNEVQSIFREITR